MLSQSGKRLVRNRIEQTAIRYRHRPYGLVAKFGIPQIVVMGHEHCGDVDAALGVVKKNIVYPRNIGHKVEPIVPAVLRVKAGMDASQPYDLETVVDGADCKNVSRILTCPSTSEPLLIELLQRMKPTNLGDCYDLDNKSIELFGS